MKKAIIITLLQVIALVGFGQELGNAYYLNRVDFSNSIDNLFQQQTFDPININLTVKGLANVQADSYVAIFNVSQMGKTVEEVNALIDGRINGALEPLKKGADVEIFVDMISFVPKYEVVVEKKRFSKNSYNEVPAGFELKKNIHIRYKDPNYLNEIIASMSAHEIYDMVRVDYFSSEIEDVKKELKKKAILMMQEKIGDYEMLVDVTLDKHEKDFVESYKVMLPAELYRSYEVYSRSSLDGSKHVNQTNMAKTHYYQPIVEKEFDFVMHSSILNPVIQVTYQVTMRIKKKIDKVAEVSKKVETVIQKEFILVTPEGVIKPLVSCKQ